MSMTLEPLVQRILQEGGEGNYDPSANPTNSSSTLAPGGSSSTQPPAADQGSASSPFAIIFGYEWFVAVLLVVILVFACWCCYGAYRRKREQRLLDLRSQQADRVLGDMQMVPNEDLDSDRELL